VGRCAAHLDGSSVGTFTLAPLEVRTADGVHESLAMHFVNICCACVPGLKDLELRPRQQKDGSEPDQSEQSDTDSTHSGSQSDSDHDNSLGQALFPS